MDKTKLLWGAGLMFLALFVWFFSGSSDNENRDIIVSPERGEFNVTVTSTGELRAKNSTKIQGPLSARRAGIWQLKISKLVPEGTLVKTGEFVAELDKAEISDKINVADAELQKSQSEYTRTKLDTALTLSEARDQLINLRYGMEEMKLKMEESSFEAPSVRRQAEIDYERSIRTYEQAKKNYVTKEQQSIAEMQGVAADLRQKQQRLEVLKETMQQFTVLAPSDGMVIYAKEWGGQKKIVGSSVSSWNPVVATLPDLSRMESITYINEVDIQKISVGQSVQIGLDADPDRKLTGEITEVANIGEQRPNSDSKVFEVLIVVNETDSTLRPAMTTSNEILTATIDNALYIPLECLHTKDEITFVYKKNGFSAVRQEVNIGMLNENEATILAGLNEGDKVYLSTPKDGESLSLERLEKTESEEQTISAR